MTDFYIDGVIDSPLLKQFRQQLSSPYCGVNVHIYISSTGGEVRTLLGLMDLIDIYRKKGTNFFTYGIGHAESCGAILLAYGDIGRRYCTSNCLVVMHFGSCNRQLVKYSQIKEKLLLQHTGVNWTTKYKKKKEYTLIGDEAKAHGLVDYIQK